MPCRIELDWIGGLVELVGFIFFTIGFATKYWAVSSDGTANSGLFTTCKSPDNLCYATHVYYDAFSEKGQIIGVAVLQMLVMCGFILVIVCMLLYMFGLFDEKEVGFVAALGAYSVAFLGFISIIIYGSVSSKLSQTLSWSFALDILGLIGNLVGGVFIHLGSRRFVEPKPLPPPPLKPRVSHLSNMRHHIARRLLNKRPLLPR